MSLIVLFVAALATARLAQLLISDDFGPLTDLRALIHSRWPGEDTRFFDTTGDPRLADATAGKTDGGLDVWPEYEDGIRVWYAAEPHPIGRLFECIRCMSVWSGLAVTVAWWLLPEPVLVAVLAPFALSQAAILLTRGE